MDPETNPIFWKAYCANGDEITEKGLIMHAIKDRTDVVKLELLYKDHIYRADLANGSLWVDSRMVLNIDVSQCEDVLPIPMTTRAHRAHWTVEQIWSATVGFNAIQRGVSRKATIKVEPDGSYEARLI